VNTIESTKQQADNIVIPSRVRLINDPAKVGILTGRKRMQGDKIMLQVQFADGISYRPESQLEIIDDIRLSPLDMLESERLARPIDLRRTLTHVKLAGRLADVIYSMEATNTDYYAYQFKPVVKILESPSNGILIADEVGLGKTIEAGLIWTELRSRFDMRRLVVLCPAALREKWQLELSQKMGVSAQICDAKETLAILKDDYLHDRGFAIIASLQGLRPPRGWDNDLTIKRSSAELARFLSEMESHDRLIDLLVIDEAHHLRNQETKNNELGKLFKNVSEYSVFLTATPIHNRNDDLFALLRLLDPDTFNRIDVFRQIIEANKPLIKARDLVLGPNLDYGSLKTFISEARRHSLLTTNRQLIMLEQADYTDEQLNSREVRSRLAYRLETVNLLSHVVTRTRKRDVKESRVIREPFAEFVDLEPVEKRFYDLVSEVVIKYAKMRSANELFLLAQPQRQMTSSMAATLRNWQRKLVELEEMSETGISSVDEKRRNALGPLVSEIVTRSMNYVELNDLLTVDSKYKRLIKILSDYFNDHPQEKVIIFSTFRATLDYLAERMKEDGVSCILLKGGQKETKQEIIDAFADPTGPSVLLSSEVGGEGVDLQFSRMLVNYDLPWNPMRLEQRIGRIDRLGQNADKVLIWNLLYSDTIDSRIYERLYDKLNLCREALGDFEAILGDEIRKLEIDLLTGQLSAEQVTSRIEQTAQAFANLRLVEEQLEQEASSLVAYGDYILNHVQAARELNRWISGDDICKYVFDYLKLHYPGCELRQTEQDKPVYEVLLSQNARFDLAEYIKTKKISSSLTRLTSSTRLVRCRFENRIAGPSSRLEEVVSQFHPLVRLISEKITSDEQQLTPAVAVCINKAAIGFALKPGTYILGVTLWSFHGLQDTEKLAYLAAPLYEPENLIEPENAEKLAAAAADKGKEWLEAVNTIDLAQAYKVANDTLFCRLFEDYELYAREMWAKNEDRADLQLQALKEHYQRQKQMLNETLVKHQMAARDSLVKATEGRIRALEMRFEQQRMKIESRRSFTHDTREIALAVINIQ
jgi:superfamily II DNA or RNA helicase